MALINFKDIDFKKSLDENTKTLDFNGYSIEITKYLSIQNKYDLITTVLSRADEVDLYNSFKTKFYFELYLVLMYSNIVFTEEEKEDEIALYDILKSSELMDLVINNIPLKEKESLWEDILALQKAMLEYRKSIGGLINTIFDKGPGILDKVKETISSIDGDKVKMFTDILMKNLAPSIEK